MWYKRVHFLVVGVVAAGFLAGCVSLEEYDQWQNNEYEAEGKELERFEALAEDYEHSVLFEAASDEAVMRGVTGKGRVEDGVYRFIHDAESEYAHFDIDLGYLQERARGNLQRIAFLGKVKNNGTGFVEVYPGGNIDGAGENNPSSVEGNGGLANGGWTLVEFIADGDTTIVRGNTYKRTMERPLESLSIFCFHGSSIEIDYILFE